MGRFSGVVGDKSVTVAAFRDALTTDFETATADLALADHFGASPQNTLASLGAAQ